MELKILLLIDKDFIDINNIGRHICGMNYLNKNKVDAVKQMILEHFPDCNIQSIKKDAVDTFDELKTKFNNFCCWFRSVQIFNFY